MVRNELLRRKGSGRSSLKCRQLFLPELYRAEASFGHLQVAVRSCGGTTMAAMHGYGDRQRTIQERLNSTFVEPDEFLRLLLSRRVLVRSDRSEGNIRGLLDPITGRRFVIERKRLLQR